MRFNVKNGRSSQAYALLMVLVMVAIGLIVLGATLRRTATSSSLNQRNIQYNVSLNAAEAATEKVVARMRADYQSGSDSSVSGNLGLYRTSVPQVGEDSYWTGFQFTDAQGNAGQTYVGMISNKVYTPLQSQYYGLSGWRTVYRIVSNAKQTNSSYDITSAVQQDVELDSIPVFQFAIFYNSLLEFTWAAPLTVRGRTHANASIYLGSSADLSFNDLVTATGTIQKKAWAGFSLNQMTGRINFTGDPGYSTNMPVLSLPIGTNNVADAVREIINMPPSGESVDSAMGQQRFYNKAGMVILVSNATVTAIIKNAPDDGSPVVMVSSTDTAALATNFPFFTLTNTFKDQRENKTVYASQIDLGAYEKWASTNDYTSPDSPRTKHPTSNPLNILYVNDTRTLSSSQLPAVRLVNGATLPSNNNVSGDATGFTVATPNPLYIVGNYNCPNSAYLNTTNTSASVPASVVSDALTILSKSWKDTQSTSSFTVRDAANTTVNAAIVTGVVYSSGSSGSSPFSGGVMNLPRLLEDWGNGSKKLTLNTSIVNLFNSVKATAPFQNPGYYYYAPTRDFNFDSRFKDPRHLPPGTPLLGVVLRAKWVAPPPGTVTYGGL